MRYRRSAATLGLAMVIAAIPAQAALAAARPGSRSAPGTTAVKVCGEGTAVTRPSSMILTCADNGAMAGHLHWTTWTTTHAAASGLVRWRVCGKDCARAATWDSASARLTLSAPRDESGHGSLFTRLTLHVTGKTPPGFHRDTVFDEAPLAALPSATTAPYTQRPAATPSPSPRARSARSRTASPAAASGSLGYAQIEGYWIAAGGPADQAETAAAIAGAESSDLPGNIQPDEDYCVPPTDEAGWGLWQITCGNSVPEFGTDFQLLDPWNNAEAAVQKYEWFEAAGENGFDAWTTYWDGQYESQLQNVAPDTTVTDPGEYVQFHDTPPGTPASPGPDPGSTYGPPMPGSSPPPSVATAVAAPDVYLANGDIALYTVRSDGNVWGTSQSAPGGSFGDWQQLSSGGGLVGNPAVIQVPSGILGIYARTSAGQVMGTSQSSPGGTFGSWITIGSGAPDLASDPTVLLLSDGELAMYGTGTDGNVWGTSQTSPGGPWAAWQQLSTSGDFTGKPAVVQVPGSLLAIYARTSTGQVMGTDQSSPGGPFGPWITIGGSVDLASDPTVLLTSDGELAMYGTGTDGNVWGTSQESAGGPWAEWAEM